MRRIIALCVLAASLWAGAGARGQTTGTIVGWGAQVVVPRAALTGLTKVAASGYHNLGLQADGSIVAWGANWDTQCTVPEPNGGFIDIAAGGTAVDGHSLGLKADGSIVAWGANSGGECNVPPPNAGFVAVAAGGGYSGGHSLGL